MSTAKPVKNVKQVILFMWRYCEYSSHRPMAASSLVDSFFSSAILPIYRTKQTHAKTQTEQRISDSEIIFVLFFFMEMISELILIGNIF